MKAKLSTTIKVRFNCLQFVTLRIKGTLLLTSKVYYGVLFCLGKCWQMLLFFRLGEGNYTAKLNFRDKYSSNRHHEPG